MQIYRNLSKSQNCVTCILSLAAKYIFLSLKVWILSKKNKKTNKQKKKKKKNNKKQTNKTYFPYKPTQLLSFLHKSILTREQKRFKTVKLPLSSPTPLRKKKGSVVVVWRYVDTSQTINNVCKRSNHRVENMSVRKLIKRRKKNPASRIRTSDLRITILHYSPPLYQLSYRGDNDYNC